MPPTAADQARARFRQDAYRALGHRKDTLFALTQAALVSPAPVKGRPGLHPDGAPTP